MVIENFRHEKMCLELIIAKDGLSSEGSYSITCVNRYELLQLAELQRKSNLRQIMVGSISHELRTPLNVLVILLNLARNIPELPTDFHDKYFLPAVHCSDYLLNLVNDILDYTQDNFNKDLRVVYKPTNLMEVINHITELLYLKAKIRKIELISDIDEEIRSGEFNTDARRLTQILINLTGNAMKFTFKGFIKIICKVVTYNDEQGVQISVEDTGLGIKADDQKKLFEMFSMVDITKEQNSTGTGLGLYISHKISKKLGFPFSKGIEVKSTWGIGSTFSFILENKKLLPSSS